MRKLIVISFLFVTLTASLAFSQVTPIPGSCEPSGLGDSWRHCDFISATDGVTRTSGDVPLCTLKCYDLAGYEQNEKCQAPPLKKAICQMAAVPFETCVEVAEFGGVQTPNDACNEIVESLNHPEHSSGPGCLTHYCVGTTIRQGWKLISASEGHRP